MMSRSQLVLRVVLVVASLGMAVATLVAGDDPLYLALVVVAGLSGYAAWRPESHVVTLLLLVQVVHWLGTVPLPTTSADWVALLVAAVLGLVVHAAAALAASLPPAAPLPAASVARWSVRAAAVAGASVVVWGLTWAAAEQQVPGEVSLTYAAIAAVALLALSVWVLSRERRD